MNPKQLISQIKNTRQRTLELINGLNSEQMIGPRLATINPLLWEIGHTAYFHEFWVLREGDAQIASILPEADSLYDSINIAHETRWDLPLLNQDDTLDYMQNVLQAVVNKLQQADVTDYTLYLAQYAIFHEDMHTEAFTYTRQTLNYPKPKLSGEASSQLTIQALVSGDALINKTRFTLGASKDTVFCFDNEKWGHEVKLDPFYIAKTATSYAEYAEFVDAGGYQNPDYWDDESWQWRQDQELDKPLYWKKDQQSNWLIKQFDQWNAMQENNAVIHISWYEAIAWCRWAGRRLPTEAEWELAASGNPASDNKSIYPWGNAEPTSQHVNMNGYALGTINVNALADGDSAFGCRQMLGNVWEWTADTFKPFPEFEADMYQDYSQPLFNITKVLKGGAWTTRSRMIWNTWRNYYGPNRNDVFAGFRSCAM